MNTFDAPSRECCVIRRERTNTPLQALVLMNEPQFVEAARALAERALRETGPDAGLRARHMFQLCVGRPPSNVELRDLISGVEVDRKHYQANPREAKELTSLGVSPPSDSFDRVELAAWTMAANTLLALDEVVTRN
jgi:hypothetical protein